MFDPFCKHSLSAKVPSEASCRSVSANIADFATTAASQDATTSDYYIARRFRAGLDENTSNCTMDNGSITVSTASDSSWVSLSDMETYRVVASAVRFRYTGPPLSASGWFRIYKTSGGRDIDTATAVGYPDDLSSLTGLFWDYSPQELAKGVTVFINAIALDAKHFKPPTNANVGEAHEGVAIFGVGLESGATITAELRQTIEFIPYANTTGALVATPNHPVSPPIATAHSKLTGLVHVAVGNAQQVGQKVLGHAKQSIWDSIKSIGGQVLQKGEQALMSHIKSNAAGFVDFLQSGGIGMLL